MNSMNNDKKIHYKMYKSGKHRITAGVLTGAIALTLINVDNHSLTARADEQTTVTTTSSNNLNTNDNKSNVQVEGATQQSAVSSTASSSASASQSSISSSASSSVASSVAVTKSVSSSSASISSATSSKAATSVNAPEKTDSTVNPQLSANVSDSFKAHTKYIDGKTYYYNDNVMLKSQVIEDNGTQYYFGDDWALTNYTNNFATGTIA